MSRKREPDLHIEWSPDRVTALNIATGEQVSGSRLSELSSFVSRHKEALVGISRHLVFLKATRLPKAAPEDLRRLLGVQLAQLFPLPPAQLTFDFYQTADQTQEGCLTVVAAVCTDDLKQLKSELKQAGLQASRILPVALGASAVAARAGLTDALLIEQTPAGLALDVVQGGVLRLSRTVPEENDALCEAQRTQVAARAEGLPFLTVGKITLPGGRPADSSPLARLNEVPDFHLELAEERARVAKQRAAGRVRQSALLFISSVLLAAFLWSERADSEAIVQRGQAKWNRDLSRLRSIRDTKSATAQKYSAIASTLKRAFEPAQPLSDMMLAVSDSLPAGAWLTGASLERGKPVQIRGTAKSANTVAQVVSALGASPRFRDVKLVFANNGKIEDQTIVQFNITATAVGNLPMPAPEKKTKTKKKAATNAAATEAAIGK